MRIDRKTLRNLASALLSAAALGPVVPASAAEPLGFVYASGSNGVEAMRVGPDGQLSPVDGTLHGLGSATGMAIVHAANGLNLYELAPQVGKAPFGPFSIVHFTVDQQTGALTDVGEPFGSFEAYSYPDDLFGFDGFGRFGGKSELLLGACSTAKCLGNGSGRVYEIAVNPTDGSLSEDASVIFPEEGSVFSTAGAGDAFAAVSALPKGAGDVLFPAGIDHASGHIALGAEFGLTVAGVSPSRPCCAAGLALALRPGLLVANGDEVGGTEESLLFGVGFYGFSTTHVVGGGEVTPFEPFTGSAGAPIAFAGHQVVSAIVDPPSHGALQVMPEGGGGSSELPVDANGPILALLTLGDVLYVGDESGPIVQLGGVDASALAPLVPASPSVGPTHVSALAGFLTPAGEAANGGSAKPPAAGAQTSETPKPQAPHLTALAISPGRFKAASRGASIAPLKAPTAKPRGALVTFRLTATATVRFSVVALEQGRRLKKAGKTRCVKAKGKISKKLSCTRHLPMTGSFVDGGGAGATSFRFTGRLAGKSLAPGRYELLATLAGGPANATRRVGFVVER